MKLVWTNDDRVALNEWLVKSIGQKFLHYLEQQRPDFPEEADDLTKMAMAGAIAKGFQLAVNTIDRMRKLEIPAAPARETVDTVTD
jgi:hypothetical protein